MVFYQELFMLSGLSGAIKLLNNLLIWIKSIQTLNSSVCFTRLWIFFRFLFISMKDLLLRINWSLPLFDCRTSDSERMDRDWSIICDERAQPLMEILEIERTDFNSLCTSHRYDAIIHERKHGLHWSWTRKEIQPEEQWYKKCSMWIASSLSIKLNVIGDLIFFHFLCSFYLSFCICVALVVL